MNRRHATCFALFFAGILLSGCRTPRQAVRPVSREQQASYLGQLRDPRVYGYGIYSEGGRTIFRGGTRLRPRQSEALPMQARNPLRPVVEVRGSFGEQWPVLIDITSPRTWINFTPAQRLRAVPVGEHEPIFVQRSFDAAPAVLSVIPGLRFGQLQIESPLVYVRLANGSKGLAARGVERPMVEGVIGWDLLRHFEQVRFEYGSGHLLLFTQQGMDSPPERVVLRIPMLDAPACTVEADVDGQRRRVLIDPAGDFEVAVDPGETVRVVRLGEGVEFSGRDAAVSPGGLRIGAHGLQEYVLIFSPRQGVLTLERR